MNASHPAESPGTGRECWLPTLQLSAQEVFGLMLGSALEMPSEPPDGAGLEITAMVGLAGKLCGVLSLHCSAKSAARMASRMLGTNSEEASPETRDAIGEVCNMVAGNFKNKISGLGDGCMLSVPTVISGQDYSLRSLAADEIRTTLLFEGEPLLLSLELHE
jgi:chemotaxis protein CheX